jgi:hypothetical protein
LAQDRRVVKINLLAYQIVAFEKKDTRALDLHPVSSGSDTGPNTAMRATESDFHDDRVIRVVECQPVKPKIRKRPEQLTEQSVNGLRAVGYRSHRWNLVAGMTEGSHSRCDIVGDCLGYNVRVHNSFPAFPETWGTGCRHILLLEFSGRS